MLKSQEKVKVAKMEQGLVARDDMQTQEHVFQVNLLVPWTFLYQQKFQNQIWWVC